MKTKFFRLCDVIFLARLQEKFEIDHSLGSEKVKICRVTPVRLQIIEDITKCGSALVTRNKPLPESCLPNEPTSRKLFIQNTCFLAGKLTAPLSSSKSLPRGPTPSPNISTLFRFSFLAGTCALTPARDFPVETTNTTFLEFLRMPSEDLNILQLMIPRQWPSERFLCVYLEKDS